MVSDLSNITSFVMLVSFLKDAKAKFDTTVNLS